MNCRTMNCPATNSCAPDKICIYVGIHRYVSNTVYMPLGDIFSTKQVLNKYFYLLGTRFLKYQHISARIREICFAMIMISVTCGFLLLNLVAIVTRNREYSIYQLISTDCSSFASLFVFVIFLFVETILNIDLIINAVFLCTTLYLYYFTMDFWLQKIW